MIAHNSEQPAARLALLHDALRNLGPLQETDVRLPESGAVVRVLRPVDTDLLLDLIEGDPEENLPYWAEIWPSGIALADAITSRPWIVRGRRTLEIGCGLGITAIAALRAGADLTVTDYAPPALTLCHYNALVNADRGPESVQLNWRNPSAEFLELAGDGYPIVLAADVLYESRDIEPLLALVERVVAPDGLLWLAEPGRPVARRFVDLARARGWISECRAHTGPWPDPKETGIEVTVYRLRRAMRDKGTRDRL